MAKFFCEQCFSLCEAANCAICGGSTRLVQGDDMVLLSTTDAAHVDIISGLLKSFDVKVLVQSQQGQGFVLRAGPMLESYRIYVPYQQYERANELINTAWV